MKVCVFCRHFWPEKLDALPRTVYEISKNLPNWQFDVISNKDPDHPTIETEISKNLNIKYVKNPFSVETSELEFYDKFVFFGSMIGGSLFCKSYSTEILEDSFLFLYTRKVYLEDLKYLKATDFIKDKRIRFVIFTGFGNFIPDLYLKKYLSRVEKVIVNSYDLKKFYFRVLKGDVLSIPHGVDTNKFKPLKKSSVLSSINIPEIDENDRVILYLGHSYFIRGIDTIIFALKKLLLRNPNEKFKLILVLNSLPDSSSNKVTNTARKVIPAENLFIINGYVKHPEYFYNLADVVALPYRCGLELPGYPFVLLEAMSCGSPIVTSPVAGIPEMIKPHNGVIINPKLIDSVVNGIIQALEKPEIGKNARESVLNFDWKCVTNNFKEVLENED